jgi:hypothetical protein
MGSVTFYHCVGFDISLFLSGMPVAFAFITLILLASIFGWAGDRLHDVSAPLIC